MLCLVGIGVPSAAKPPAGETPSGTIFITIMLLQRGAIIVRHQEKSFSDDVCRAPLWVTIAVSHGGARSSMLL